MKSTPNKLNLLTKTNLHKLYWDEKLSTVQVATLLGVSQGAIWRRMSRWNIARRNLSEATSLAELGRKRRRDKRFREPNLQLDTEFAYLLGILYGDGSHFKNGRSYTITLSPGTNERLALSWKELLERRGLRVQVVHELQKYWKLFTSSKLLFRYLDNNLNFKRIKGILNNNALITSFWRGLFDAEGHLRCSIYNGIPQSIAISNNDKEMMEWGKDILLSRGYDPQLYVIIKKEYKPSYLLQLTNQKNAKWFLTEFEPLKI